MSVPGEKYFEFIVGLSEVEQVRVRVYRAQSTGKDIPRLTPSDRDRKPSETDFQMIINLLVPGHLEVPPAPTATLVEIPERNIRIDTQPATAVYRNIHVQRGSLSYSAVTIDHGAELCEVVGYENKLLRYLKDGLRKSYTTLKIFNILVTVEKKKKGPNPWIIIAKAELDVRKLGQIIASRLKHKAEMIVAKRLESAKNVSKLVRGTELIEHVTAAIEKHVAKLAEKEGGHIIAKKIPIVSTFVGIFFGAIRASEGDYAGAFAEVASGVLADIPGAGTAASLAIDAGLMGRDIAALLKEERNHKRLLEGDIEALKERNKTIRKQLADLLPESQIYGAGSKGYFDESDLADVDEIVKIHVRCGDLIDGIQVEYRHGGKGKYHGGKGGGTHTFTLGPDERVTAVKGSVYSGVISSLTFVTDCGREETFGIPKGDNFIYELPDASFLAAIKGYDFYNDCGNPSKRYPMWKGNYELLPGIGFIGKY